MNVSRKGHESQNRLTPNEYLTFLLRKWFADNMGQRQQVQSHADHTLEGSTESPSSQLKMAMPFVFFYRVNVSFETINSKACLL